MLRPPAVASPRTPACKTHDADGARCVSARTEHSINGAATIRNSGQTTPAAGSGITVRPLRDRTPRFSLAREVARARAVARGHSWTGLAVGRSGLLTAIALGRIDGGAVHADERLQLAKRLRVQSDLSRSRYLLHCSLFFFPSPCGLPRSTTGVAGLGRARAHLLAPRLRRDRRIRGRIEAPPI